MAAADVPPAGRAYRPDIDGLRALAVLLIVGYHVHLAGFDGGFIGVDVFFVISGYLITRNLLAEVADSGRVSLGSFWARRIRRLVPGLALMVLATVGLGLAIRPALDWPAMASQGRAAALYVSNLYFARQAADYFGTGVQRSLFLHTWSLGVEEQFYLVWPLLVGGIVWFARKVGPAPRRLLAVAFGGTFVASFALSVHLTNTGSTQGFYGLQSRAWEFAVAGLLAVLPVPSWLGGAWVRRVLGLGGLAGIIGAGVLYTDAGLYPGVRALLPVLATLAVLAAGSSAAGSAGDPHGRLLGAAPVRWVGRVSYSWYLWHWPLILLAVDQTGRDTVPVRFGAAAAALVIGAAAYRFVERPLRTAPWLVRPQWRTYAAGAAITSLVVAATVAVGAAGHRDLASGQGTTLAQVRAAQRAEVCNARLKTPSGISYCQDGDPNGTRSVLLVGDSHARHWTPAFDQAGKNLGIKVLVRWRPLCPGPAIRLTILHGKGPDLACEAFRRDTAKLITELKPDAVVPANSHIYGLLVLGAKPHLTEADRHRIWQSAYRRYLTDLRAQGIKVGSIIETPRLPGDAVDCIAAKGVDGCAFDRRAAFAEGATYADAEANARKILGRVPTLDITDVLCGPKVCSVKIGGQYVYADIDHLYQGFVLTQTPAVETFLKQVLAGP